MCPVRDETNETPSTAIDRTTEESGFVGVARTVSEPVRRLIHGVHSDRGLGLLCTIDDRGEVAVRDLLRGDLCESDLHGLCGELRAASLIEECEVAGERGYRTTAVAHEALERVRTA